MLMMVISDIDTEAVITRVAPDMIFSNPNVAGFGHRIWKFGRISAGVGAGCVIRCNPSHYHHDTTI